MLVYLFNFSLEILFCFIRELFLHKTFSIHWDSGLENKANQNLSATSLKMQKYDNNSDNNNNNNNNNNIQFP